MAQDISANNKRIAKNTFIMYFRQFFTMCITLYTSRVILSALGVEDFGIYNVVGGFVGMFALFTSALAVAVIRFITFELGKNDIDSMKKVFSTSCFIMASLTVLISFISLTGGLWFVNNELVIPAERLGAARIVYILCVVSFALNLLALPYSSAVVAHEHMSTYACISIIDAIIRLIIALTISLSPIDKLVYYAIMLLVGMIIMQSLFIVYARRNFVESRSNFKPDRNKLKEMFGFAAWNVIGGLAAILRDQGSTVLLNMFFGPVVNAAKGITNQVCNAVNSFVVSFQSAITPQITKSYASGNIEYYSFLISQASRISYFIVLVLSMPIIFNTELVINVWLGQIPEYCVSFIRIVFLYTLTEAIANPIVNACSATGNMRRFQLWIAPITTLNIPVSYILLKCGFIPETVLIVMVVIAIINLFVKVIVLSKLTDFSFAQFVKSVIWRCSLVTVLASIVPLLFYKSHSTDLTYSLAHIALCILSTVIAVLFVGCSSTERHILYRYIKAKVCMKQM